MEGRYMRRKIIVFIGVMIIPFLILAIDYYVLDDKIEANASYDKSHAWKYIYDHQEEYPYSLIKLALNNEKLPVYGDGRNIRDWLYVEDHCEAIDLVYLKI